MAQHQTFTGTLSPHRSSPPKFCELVFVHNQAQSMFIYVITCVGSIGISAGTDCHILPVTVSLQNYSDYVGINYSACLKPR
jgi:hypothetical protein